MTHTVFPSKQSSLVEIHQRQLGTQIRGARLAQNLPQDALAEKAGIAIGALKNLESGRGASLRTLTSVVCALGRQEWLSQLGTGSLATDSPLSITTTTGKERQRARTIKMSGASPMLEAAA